MPVTIEEVSVETISEAPGADSGARPSPEAAAGGDRVRVGDLPQLLQNIREREERVRAH